MSMITAARRVAGKLALHPPVAPEQMQGALGKSLTTSNVQNLIKGRIPFIQVSQFASPESCRTVVDRVYQDHTIQEYANAKGVNKVADIGMAYFETTEGEERKEKYYSSALASIAKTRDLFTPYFSPLDKLRLELEEKWPGGSNLLDLGQGKMFCGLFRVLSGEVLAHEDKLERDHGKLPEDIQYQNQLAANVYLQVPKIGGELMLWNRSLEDHDYDILRGDSYGIKPEILGPPDHIVKPKEGDLILFNPRNLHAIKPSIGKARITLSTFILNAGSSKPLSFWS